VGGHDISVLGPFASLIRAGAQAVGGRADMTDIEQRGRGLVWGKNAPKPEPFEAAKSFARAKASPVFSTAWSYITGATFDGKPIERDPTKPEFYTRTLAELGKESLPFSVQAALEEGPLAAATSAVGLQGSPVTPVERRNFARDEVARELFGVPYGELESAEQRAQV